MAKKNAASKRQAKEIAHARAPEVSEADYIGSALEPVQEEVRRTLPGSEEEAAREHLMRATSELVEHLLLIMNDKNDPGLSAIDNQRRRYANILHQLGIYFEKIGRDKLRELGTYIGSLGVALEDLIRGVTDPLFVTKGSKRDSMRIWGARMQAALGLECFIQSGLSRERAASEAATKYEALTELIRIAGADLKGSLLSWYDSYIKSGSQCPSCWRRSKRRTAQSRQPNSRGRNTEELAINTSSRPSEQCAGLTEQASNKSPDSSDAWGSGAGTTAVDRKS
jgi:hypothetical protein